MLYFVTSSLNKFNEAKDILKIPMKRIALDLPEIQSLDVTAIVRSKARNAFQKIKKPCLVEDTGLYLEVLNGFPGALAKWVEHSMGWKKFSDLIQNAKNRRAIAKCAICYYDGEITKVFMGSILGKISAKPRGKNNFGWDPIFIPQGETKTFAEMTTQEKNQNSHRSQAFKKLAKFLRSL